jgi:hypothetical protein
MYKDPYFVTFVFCIMILVIVNIATMMTKDAIAQRIEVCLSFPGMEYRENYGCLPRESFTNDP